MRPFFRDRAEAGKRLAERLERYRGEPGGLILALVRGGLPVALEIARTLALPMDLLTVRKLGFPAQPELAMGAIASGGVRVLNEDLLDAVHADAAMLQRVTAREMRELERREALYVGDRARHDPAGRTVLLVDDGLATGATMLAAADAVRTRGPARLVVAAPVASSEAVEKLSRRADEVVTLATPEPFYGVGAWYDSFPQITDEEVRDLLEAATLASPRRSTA